MGLLLTSRQKSKNLNVHIPYQEKKTNKQQKKKNQKKGSLSIFSHYYMDSVFVSWETDALKVYMYISIQKHNNICISKCLS